MTEEERKEQERQKEWVKVRYNCTIKAVFSHLYDVVKSDVKAFNDLDRRMGYECIEAENTPEVFLALPIDRNHHGKDPSVRFARRTKHIQITSGDGADFTVEPQWDESGLECKLMIDGETYSYPQISQKAIGSLLFNCATYPGAL